jgi:hypothetical protein
MKPKPAEEVAREIVKSTCFDAHEWGLNFAMAKTEPLIASITAAIEAERKRLKEVEDALDAIKVRNLLNGIKSICEKCGGHKANSKCVECLEAQVEELSKLFLGCSCGGRKLIVNGKVGCPDCGN